MIIKLERQIIELKAENNTLQIENELLRDRRIDDLLKELDKENKCEELEKQVRHLEAKVEGLKEIIKELKNVKKKS